MTDLKFFTISLLCVCGVVSCLPLDGNSTDAENGVSPFGKYRLPNDTLPIHYNVKIDLNLDVKYFTYSGDIAVDFEVLKATSDVVLHSKYLAIDESSTSLKTASGNEIKPREHVYDNDTEMLHVQFDDPLQPGVYTLSLNYESRSRINEPRGLYQSLYMGEHEEVVAMAATHLQPIFARRVFPCWDEPALKATFNISLRHHNNYTALSNMPVRAVGYDDGEGRKVWTHFETTPIMSTNILGFIVANYTCRSNSDGTTRVWTKESSIDNVEYVIEMAERATAQLTRFMNSTVRVPKMDHVTVPQYSSRATENWGLIVYHEFALVHDNSTDSFRSKATNILTIVHEIAHQWFGNLVSPSWWKYFWMSEGMATYMKYFITDKMFADWKLMDLFVIHLQQQRAFVADERSNAVPINKDFHSPQDIRIRDPTIIYQKSASILRMLSHIVSEDVFRTGLINYVDAHEYSSITSDDLWNAMQDALDKSNLPHEDFHLKEAMDTWIEQTGYPLVTATRDYATGVTTIRQEVSPTNKDMSPKKWWIPLSYATKSNPDFSSTLPARWLRPSDENLTIEGIDPEDWIIVNLQETGYYRVNYDKTNWERIAEYLNSDDYQKIHVINRAQIIDDSFRLMQSGRLSPIVFLKLTNYLSREIEYVPWASAFNVLPVITVFLRHPIGHAVLKPHILGLMDNLIEHVGFEEVNDDEDYFKMQKLEILIWACQLGHRACREKATERLIAHLEYPEANTVPTDLKYWTFCMGVLSANQTVWNKFFELYKNDITYEIHRYLGCTEDPAIAENYLNMAISNETSTSESFSSNAFTFLENSLYTDPEPNLNFVISNWEKIKHRMPHNSDWIVGSLIRSVQTQEQFDKLKAFIEANKIKVDHNLEYREEALTKLEKNIKKIRSWINEVNAGKEGGSTVTATLQNSP